MVVKKKNKKKEANLVNNEQLDLNQDILKDITFASQILTEGNKKLLLKIKTYEDKISLLKEEIIILKEKISKNKINELNFENQNFKKAIKKLSISNEKHLMLLNEVKSKLKMSTHENLKLENEIGLLKNILNDKKDTLSLQAGALKARKDEAKLARDVNKRLFGKDKINTIEYENLKDDLLDKNIHLKRMIRVIEKLSSEVHKHKQVIKLDRKKIISYHNNFIKSKQNIEILNKEILKHKEKKSIQNEHLVELTNKNSSLVELLKKTEKEKEKMFIDINIMRESIIEKDRLLNRLDKTLESKKKETKLILEINKKLLEKERQLSLDHKRLVDLAKIKDLKSKQYLKTLQKLDEQFLTEKKDFDKHKLKLTKLMQIITEKDDKIKIIQSDYLNLKKEFNQSMKEREIQESDVEIFKEKIRNLFGVNKELEGKTARFSDYLEKLRTLFYNKQKFWDEKEKKYKAEIENTRYETDEKIKRIIRKDTNEIISLKSIVASLKQELKNKEQELYSKDLKEKNMLLSIANQMKAWVGNKEPAYLDDLSLSIAQKEKEVKRDLTELNLMRDNSKVMVYDSTPDEQSEFNKNQVLCKEDNGKHDRNNNGDIRVKINHKKEYLSDDNLGVVGRSWEQGILFGFDEPLEQSFTKEAEVDVEIDTKHQELLEEKKKTYVSEDNLHKKDYNLRKYYKKTDSKSAREILDAMENPIIRDKPKEAIYVEGEIKKENNHDDDDFVSKKRMTPASDTNIIYNKDNVLYAMVDVGLQHGQELDEIKQSLIKTGYKEEDVDKVISSFKKNKIGGF